MDNLVTLEIREPWKKYEKQGDIYNNNNNTAIYKVKDRKDPRNTMYALKQQNIRQTIGNNDQEVSVNFLRMMR